jgi:hypothetical protein
MRKIPIGSLTRNREVSFVASLSVDSLAPLEIRILAAEFC